MRHTRSARSAEHAARRAPRQAHSITHTQHHAARCALRHAREAPHTTPGTLGASHTVPPTLPSQQPQPFPLEEQHMPGQGHSVPAEVCPCLMPPSQPGTQGAFPPIVCWRWGCGFLPFTSPSVPCASRAGGCGNKAAQRGAGTTLCWALGSAPAMGNKKRVVTRAGKQEGGPGAGGVNGKGQSPSAAGLRGMWGFSPPQQGTHGTARVVPRSMSTGRASKVNSVIYSKIKEGRTMSAQRG